VKADSKSSASAEDRLLRKSEAAIRLACSPRTLERLVASGRLPCVRVLSGVRFRVSDVAQLISKGVA